MTDPLFIDIGNSAIKMYRLSPEGTFHDPKFFPYVKKSFEFEFSFLIKSLLSNEPSDEVYLINSDINQNAIIAKIFSGLKTNLHCLDINSPGLIKIDYEDSLGTDRYCAANGASSKYPDKNNILVIDFGTATTFNFIEENIFTGGLIFPGIDLSFNMLSSGTSLPKAEATDTFSIKEKTTLKNISSGVIAVNTLGINALIKKVKDEYQDLFIAATGGNFESIKSLIEGIDIFDPDLKFEGMKVLYSKMQDTKQ